MPTVSAQLIIAGQPLECSERPLLPCGPLALGGDSIADRLYMRHSTDKQTNLREGIALKALAREYSVDPKVIRRVLDSAGARDMPSDPYELLGELGGEDNSEPEASAPADPVVSIDVPGLLAEHLQDAADVVVRDALRGGRTVRRGRGYSLRVAAPLSSHRAALEACAALAADGAAPAGRKAYRIYADRVGAAPAARGMTAGTALLA
ncbi:hypothetical protein QJ054_32915 [Streptomyces sp. AN-3]|uniref:Uncharacterized protein n=1 Tax=Streptomyces rochei TaxID=1928 RepID=A0ABW7E909_STRRO|nr:hypothetical protein [Streptomyces sp. AN-3]MDI3101847.1 hypothetical protein [Streptomyces sp. AN-3]